MTTQPSSQPQVSPSEHREMMRKLLQQQIAQLDPGASITLAALAATATESENERLETLWLAAELAQSRGRLRIAIGLLAVLDAMATGPSLSPLRRQSLERAERLAYLVGDLDAAWHWRLTLRKRLTLSNNPAEQAEAKQEPLRQWRLELGADPEALSALNSINEHPRDAALRELAGLVVRHPQATVLAFGLLQRLRQAGWLEQPATMEEGDQAIPAKLWLLRPHPGWTPELEKLGNLWLTGVFAAAESTNPPKSTLLS